MRESVTAAVAAATATAFAATATTAWAGAEMNGDMPQLVGSSIGAASEHIQLMGGPALSGQAGNWGATLFSGR